MSNTRIGNHSHISNSVIGINNSIGPYFITEDKENLKIEMEEEIQTVNKLGTITGDDNIIGNRVLVKAGAMISSNCTIDSGKIISRNLPENSIVV